MRIELLAISVHDQRGFSLEVLAKTPISTQWNNATLVCNSTRTIMPELRSKVGALTPKLEQVIHILEWVRIEEFVRFTWSGCGRPEYDRRMLANAFVAKAVLGLSTTTGLIERLTVDRALRGALP